MYVTSVGIDIIELIVIAKTGRSEVGLSAQADGGLETVADHLHFVAQEGKRLEESVEGR